MRGGVVSITTMAAVDASYKVKDWLQGKTAITISDETIKSICADRHVDPDEPYLHLGQREKDLCLADLYMFCVALPTSTATIDDKNGNWEHKEGSVTMSGSDRKHLRLLAYRLYRKWGLPIPSMSSVKFGVSGIRNRRR